MEILLYVINLNTSHVKVNRLEVPFENKIFDYLNTSHVKVNPFL